jgi:hypothetical protein
MGVLQICTGLAPVNGQVGREDDRVAAGPGSYNGDAARTRPQTPVATSDDAVKIISLAADACRPSDTYGESCVLVYEGGAEFRRTPQASPHFSAESVAQQ